MLLGERPSTGNEAVNQGIETWAVRCQVAEYATISSAIQPAGQPTKFDLHVTDFSVMVIQNYQRLTKNGFKNNPVYNLGA